MAWQMPVICEHELIGERKSNYRYKTWTNIADRGIYGYDYDLQKKLGYKLITIPNRPVRVCDASCSWARSLPVFAGVFGKDSMMIPSPPVQKWLPP